MLNRLVLTYLKTFLQGAYDTGYWPLIGHHSTWKWGNGLGNYSSKMRFVLPMLATFIDRNKHYLGPLKEIVLNTPPVGITRANCNVWKSCW